MTAFCKRPLSFGEAEGATRRYRAREAEAGLCLLALTSIGNRTLIRVAGIQAVPFQASFTPAVEVGWRLARARLGHGFASEAAAAATAYGFEPCGLREIVAIARPHNTRSLAVMQTLGMRRDADADFDHPGMLAGYPLQHHCLHRAQAPAPSFSEAQ